MDSDDPMAPFPAPPGKKYGQQQAYPKIQNPEAIPAPRRNGQGLGASRTTQVSGVNPANGSPKRVRIANNPTLPSGIRKRSTR